MKGDHLPAPTDTVAPLLSICVPTYNRARGLRNLFHSLHAAKKRFGDTIEICVSNNHSADDTARVIDEWQPVLGLKVLTQNSNLGATLNIIAVTTIATGAWNVWIGDDDELISGNLGPLLDLLRSAAPDDWVLVGIANGSGQEHLLGSFDAGRCSKRAFRTKLLATGLQPLGFMGMHVFPAAARPKLAALTVEQAKPWPPIALFLREMQTGCVHVFKSTIMIQAKGDAQLFWNAADIAKVWLSRTRIIANVDATGASFLIFLRLLMLRELYSSPNLQLLAAWRLYEDENFRREALPLYFQAYAHTGALALFAIPHLVLVTALRIAPYTGLRLLARMAGRQHYIDRYATRKSELKMLDGLGRGL